MSHRFGRTHRLELDDSTLREWSATVLDVDEDGIVLDRSAFYPGGGGQPPDNGVLLWGNMQTAIVGVRKVDDCIRLIPGENEVLPAVGEQVQGALDDERRTALMRTHSALHMLSGIVFRDFEALVTGSNMEPLSGRLDFNLDAIPEGFMQNVENAVNEEVLRDRAIIPYSLPRAEALAIPDVIRTAANLLPADLEVVRIVDIDGLDVQADGGTHVASTRFVGAIRVTKVENKGRGFRRCRIQIMG